MADETVLLLNKDKPLRIAFEAVVMERRIRLGELLEKVEKMGEDQESVPQNLEKLEAKGLIKSKDSPGHVASLRWYSVTAQGLAIEQELKKVHLV